MGKLLKFWQLYMSLLPAVGMCGTPLRCPTHPHRLKKRKPVLGRTGWYHGL